MDAEHQTSTAITTQLALHTMAYSGPTIAVPDSSPSSVSGQSPRDTPATRLTHLSPNVNVPRKLASSIHDATEPPLFHLQHCQDNGPLSRPVSIFPAAVEQDPFMIHLSPKDRQIQEEKRKLSATATVFKPQGPCTLSFDSNIRPAMHSTGDGLPTAETPGSMARRELPSSMVGTHRDLESFEHLAPIASSSAFQHHLDVHFVTGPSRYIMVAGLPKQSARLHLDALLAVPVIAQSRIAVSDHIVQSGMVILRYDDLRFAAMALAKIGSEFPGWTSGFVTPQCWTSFARATCDPPASELEGQVLVTISLLEDRQRISIAGQAEYFAAVMHARMSVYGEVRSLSCMLATASMVALKFEFHSLAASNSPGLENQSSPFPGLRLTTIRQGISPPNVRMHAQPAPMVLAKLQGPARPLQLPTGSCQIHFPHSPELNRLNMANSLTRTPRKWISPLPRSIDLPSASHNVVDIERIRRGQDVRTTIMLRNIPNKVDQPMLKEIVDETSRGKYDFMYLRIDFANNCNVGYAFINFEDSQYIIDFVEAVAGKRWNRFNSDKVAEVSYATIQGKDCLVQKFRNSSVMLEAPLFRPKIFQTGEGPLAGQEETFPPPDNHSKMRRSLENAEHVGLFAPRVGQRFRDEQRRRRSRYDRGTRLAEIEEFGHEDELNSQPNLLAFPTRSASYPTFQLASQTFY